LTELQGRYKYTSCKERDGGEGRGGEWRSGGGEG